MSIENWAKKLWSQVNKFIRVIQILYSTFQRNRLKLSPSSEILEAINFGKKKVLWYNVTSVILKPQYALFVYSLFYIRLFISCARPWTNISLIFLVKLSNMLNKRKTVLVISDNHWNLILLPNTDKRNIFLS